MEKLRVDRVGEGRENPGRTTLKNEQDVEVSH